MIVVDELTGRLSRFGGKAGAKSSVELIEKYQYKTIKKLIRMKNFTC